MKIPIPLSSTLSTDSHKNDIKDPSSDRDLFNVNRSYFFNKDLTNAKKKIVPAGGYITTKGDILSVIPTSEKTQIYHNGQIIADVLSLGIEDISYYDRHDAVIDQGFLWTVRKILGGYAVEQIDLQTQEITTTTVNQDGVLDVRFVRNTHKIITKNTGGTVTIDGMFYDNPGMTEYMENTSGEFIAVQANDKIYFGYNNPASVSVAFVSELLNGLFYILDITGNTILSSPMTGRYLSHYNNTWVISKTPERRSGSFGTATEWEVLYDINTQAWLPVAAKNIYIPADSAEIVDVNVVGPFVDYVIKYHISSGVNYYFRDRNIDGVFRTENYSIFYMGNQVESILGPYDTGNETYIKTFNGSVMLYPNLRLVINGNFALSCSYAVTPNRIGTLLAAYGDLADDVLPSMFFYHNKQYLITKTANGYIRVMRLGTDIPERISRIAQYIHKINTVDVVNLLIEKETRIDAECGSLDWNNKFQILVSTISPSIPQTINTYHINSGYNPNYEQPNAKRSSSMITSDTLFTLYGTIANSDSLVDGYNINYWLNFIGAELPNDSIDVFIDSVSPPQYQYSLINNTNRIDTRLTGVNFPNGVMVPFPLSTRWNIQNEVIATGEMSIGLLAIGLTNENKTLDLYDQHVSQVYFGESAFQLFGILYVFDGDYIYQAGSERIAMAFGYIFLGCDNNAAYFYNPWDKSVYQFTGSRSLGKFINVSNRTHIKTGRYDGMSGEMVLLAQDEILKTREGIIMNFPYVPGTNIISTKAGAYVYLQDGSRLLLTPSGGDVDAFDVVTGFIGIDGSTVCDYERVDVRLHSRDNMPLCFTVELQTINQDTKESEKKTITLKSGDWSSDGYKTVKLIPQYKKGTGLSLRIYSENEIFVAGIEFTYNPAARTANSQRDAF